MCVFIMVSMLTSVCRLAAGELLQITNTQDLMTDAVKSILASATTVALACEVATIEEETVMAVLQVMIPEKALYIIDIMAPNVELSALSEILRPLLENADVLHIVFNASVICRLLYEQLGLKTLNVYDVVKAHIAVLRQKYEQHPRFRANKPFQDPTGIILPKLIQTYAETPYTDAYRHVSANPGWWLQRPMTDMMRDYAMKDVLFLRAVQQNVCTCLSVSLFERSLYYLRFIIY